MSQPLEFEQQNANRDPLVCKLDKIMYGLKQAPMAWFDNVKTLFYHIT